MRYFTSTSVKTHLFSHSDVDR